jgi:hypothetical protein
MPAKTMVYKHMDANTVKNCKERITLLLTANMDGSQKLKPLVIGKFEKPRCFTGLNRANLKCTYRHNKAGWMTGELFKEWIEKLDKTMKEENRFIIMFVDNFAGHSPNKNEAPYALTNIVLEYFPANCTSVIQPMDMGIINAFKIRYRTQVVNRRIEQIEYGDDGKQITVLDAINYCDYAWRHTTQQTLQNCWRKAGFKAHQYEIDEEGFDIIPPTEYDEYKNKWNELNRVSKTYDFNQDEYITVDDAVPFAGALTDEEIVASVLPALEEVVEEENETSQEAVVKVSNREAIKSFESLKLYLTQSSEDRSASLKLLERIEKDLEVAKAQSSIKDFFSC